MNTPCSKKRKITQHPASPMLAWLRQSEIGVANSGSDSDSNSASMISKKNDIKKRRTGFNNEWKTLFPWVEIAGSDDFSAGLGGEFPPNQGMSVVHHPQSVSPSEVVEINPRNKCRGRFKGLESCSLPEPEHQDYTQKMFQVVLGGTRPEDKHPAVTTNQSKAILQTKMEPAHPVQVSCSSFTEDSTLPDVKSSSINPCTSHKVAVYPASPTMQPRTEFFGLQERLEKEEIDIALGVGRKESPKTTAAPTALRSVMAPSDEDLLAKMKRKKGKDYACSPQKESKLGVLSPRPTSARNELLVTQPKQDREAEFSEHSVVPQNDAGYETMQKEVNEDCHGHLSLARSTCRVTEQDFLTVTEQLPKSDQNGVWIVDHNLHPEEGAYLEGQHFKAERLAKGGFGTVSLCQDSVRMKQFIEKKVSKKKWRKAENIALMTLKGHPNICQLLGMKQESGSDGITISLFLEDAGMSLSNFVGRMHPDKLTLQEIWDIAEQMFCGQVDLHRHGILHLDLKPDNICIQGNRGKFNVKIIDLGFAKLSQEPFYFYGMTPEYLAPEVCTCFIAQLHGVMNLAEHLISGKADVAAGGLIILYMIEGYDVLIKPINGQTSYKDKTKAEITFLRIRLVEIHAYTPDLASHQISDGIDTDLREFLNGCLVRQPERRFSSQQALQYIRDRKAMTKGPQLISLSMAAILEQLEAKVASKDKLVVTPSSGHLQLLRHQNQQGGRGVRNCQQTTQAGERVFGLNSQQDLHGTNNFPVRVSSRNKHRDKTKPYPTHRRSSCSVSEDPHTIVATQHSSAIGVIPTTVNPEAYPAASNSQGGNLPNFDALQ